MTRAVERRTERAGDAKWELRTAGGRARMAKHGLFCVAWYEMGEKQNNQNDYIQRRLCE